MAYLRQFFTSRKNLTEGSSVKLDENEAEHIRKSLRMEPNDRIILFNGERKYRARLTMVTKDNVLVEVEDRIESTDDSEKEITLFQSLIRAHNFELVLQKATELGIDNIVPLQTEFSQIKLERVESKMERWEKIVLEACKQSERDTIPEVYLPIDFNAIETQGLVSEFDLILFFTTPREVVTKISPVTPLHQMQEKIKDAKRVALLIGPEGGFSPAEHLKAKELGFPFVSMGNTVLKAETAGIAATSFISLLGN
ncbi:MAG: 16S rRNA (uracil(1498)-N(3))-methyltransferase [Candidatus Doudnabacteria bacterium]|nr:16S rRNA (uracil(1498)-N(3))-methyltransferase [Candidatus Doudnabacteria bacterium]